MPFLGQDWRSPGEQWVKTSEGWERLRMWRLKLLENLNENIFERLVKLSPWEEVLSYQRDRLENAPSNKNIAIRSPTKEQRTQLSMAESFNILDICGSVKDIRRFNYVVRVLELLIREKVATLSGSGQRLVLNALEQTLIHVTKTQTNLHIFENLLVTFKQSLEEAHYNHVGSSQLWQRHVESVDRMFAKLKSIELHERNDDGGIMLTDLPDDCVREILLRLSDHEDVLRAVEAAPRSEKLAQERALWKAMCAFHFTDAQLARELPSGTDLAAVDWRQKYHVLVRRHGKRETYADMLHLCRHCNVLFWQQQGHRCLFPNLSDVTIPVSPAMLVDLFTS